MDEGGNRGRAFHGVREPDVERELAALADRPAEEEERRRSVDAALRDASAADERGATPENRRCRP